MYMTYRQLMFNTYNRARNHFLNHPEMLVSIEEFITHIICDTLRTNADEFWSDYDEASFLNPFWGNYPPEERGRQPKGDQIPWIEVGEHAVGHKLNRLISRDFSVREVGLPSGADNRFLLSSDIISKITNGVTNSCMAFIDIKSVGPRDDFENTVISPYQASGNGVWESPNKNIVNSPLIARGLRRYHDFYPAISPIYVLHDGLIAPAVHVFVKPIYDMLEILTPHKQGQPLKNIKIVSLPNGLLLTQNPGYIDLLPGLLYPGKDDKDKLDTKRRCRVSFELLGRIASWRIQQI